jgi:hypothetical protein
MTDDKKQKQWTRKQLDEWQRRDQRKRQELEATRLSSEQGTSDGLPLWLDVAEER